MNKMLKSLLVAALTLSAAHLSADGNSATNKTFLMPRPVGVNAAMHSTTFYDLVNRKAYDKFGANFELTGFYQQSSDGKQQGKYFLADSKSTIDVSRGDGADYLAGTSVDAGLLVHTSGYAGPDALGAATLSLDPRQEVYGVRLDYHQDLHKLVKGLYLSANLPVVHVENNPRPSVGGTDAALGARLASYFAGGSADADPAVAVDNQEALAKGKIGKKSESGVADIDVVLGYKFLNKAKYHAGLGIAVTIPTGNTATGEWMFEPMVGNGKHWGFGGDLCAGARLWSNDESNIKVNLVLKYRYLFENSERRVLGLKGVQVPNANASQYQLLQVDGAAAGAKFVPAANITALSVNVTPGSQLDADLGFSYHRGGFSADLGYNLYAREGEAVKIKESIAENYAVVRRSFNNGAAFNVNTDAHVETQQHAVSNVLTNANLNTDSAATGSQVSSAIYGGAGYVFKNWDCPLMLGAGAKYEFAHNNNALEQWGVWLKAGVGF